MFACFLERVKDLLLHLFGCRFGKGHDKKPVDIDRFLIIQYAGKCAACFTRVKKVKCRPRGFQGIA